VPQCAALDLHRRNRVVFAEIHAGGKGIATFKDAGGTTMRFARAIWKARYAAHEE
jgi:hypothetical protein